MGALELFSTKGYDATSVREICEAAGITKPTLYHFYGSKEGVYRALVEGTFEQFRSDLAAIVEAPGTALERLRRVARSYFEYAQARHEVMRFVLSTVYNTSTSAPRANIPRIYEDLVLLVARCVDEGVLRQELQPGPTEVRMLVFLGALGQCVCGSIVAGKPNLTPELADSIVDSITKGWT